MRLYKTILSILILSMVLSSCQIQSGLFSSGWQDVKSDIWWKDAVFYQVFVRSFADSNGDGLGDFKGLTSKLDYLNDGKPETTTDLGITALWLMPIHPSPSYHGYDVTDYYAIHPAYGSMEDFKTFLEEAHKRGIRVVIDFVINHTSNQHPWFHASARQDPQFADWYLWSDVRHDYKGPWGQDVWHKLGDRYYYGVFVGEMPDLNYNTPAVTEEITKISNFWLNEVGIDGFRVDGAKHLLEEGQVQENTGATHAWFKDFYSTFKQQKPEGVMVGEIWSPNDQAARYVNNDEMDLVFNFTLADDILAGATFKDARRISNSLASSVKAFDNHDFASFLSNHDQTRAMTKMGDDYNRAKAAATVLLTSPGTPFLYYGEEIGMVGDKPDPDLRTPMQWSDEKNAGFSKGNSWQTVKSDYTVKNVAAQDKDPNSLLSHYRQLIRIRSQHNALRTGQFVQVTGSQRMLFAMLRVAETESVLVLVNLSNEPLTGATLTWDQSPLKGTYRGTLLMGQGKAAPLTVNEQGGVESYQPLPEIPANTSVIIQFRP